MKNVSIPQWSYRKFSSRNSEFYFENSESLEFDDTEELLSLA